MTIGNLVPPLEQTTVAPLAPGETTTTENPAYTTTAGMTEATTAWDEWKRNGIGEATATTTYNSYATTSGAEKLH